jgi:RND family efflux transporter MFP subunit
MILKRKLVFSGILCCLMLTSLEAQLPETRLRAITTPSADITLSFVQPGCIVWVNAKNGDLVKTDQILVLQYDAVERLQLLQLEAESEDTTRIEASEASLDQKKVDLAKLERAAAHNAATALEVEHAKLDVKIAELSLELAKFEHEQAIRKYEEAKVSIEKMRLKSPIEGIVEEIYVEAGESVNALDNVIRIVQINPLWIDVPVPLDKAITLTKNEIAKVTFPNPDNKIIEGKIVYIAAVADAASGTLRVRVEVPNKSGRPAGEHVYVDFPASQQ